MGAIKTRRIKDDVIMNMRLIRMSRYDKSMIAFGKSHGGFIAYLIRFLRCDFSWLKGLPDLISDDIALRMSSCQTLIFSFREHEFFINTLSLAGVGTDELTIFGLLSILGIICSVAKRLRYAFTFILMHRDKSCSRHAHSPPSLNRRQAL